MASTDVVFIGNDNPDFGEGYRFGFNTQEKDDALKGEKNSLDSNKLITNGQSAEEYIAGEGYYGIEGVIYTDDGKEVAVILITDKNVYNCTINVAYEPMEDQYGKSVPTKTTSNISVGEILEGFDASTNCTGLAFAQGRFLIRSNNLNKALLKSEGWDKLNINQTAQAGDFGVSTGEFNKKDAYIHTLKYNSETEVTSKGRYTKREVQKAGTTFDGTTKYEIFRRSGTDKKVSRRS